MQLHELLLIALGFGAVAADIYIRLRLTPERRHAFVESLLHVLVPGRDDSAARHERERAFRPLPEGKF